MVHRGGVDGALLPVDLLTAVNVVDYRSTHTDAADCVHVCE